VRVDLVHEFWEHLIDLIDLVLLVLSGVLYDLGAELADVVVLSEVVVDLG
jgi:hypothetical protein